MAVLGLWLILPILRSPAEAALFVGTLVVADLVVLFLFGGALIRRTLIHPLDRLSDHVHRIAAGDLAHRVPDFDIVELQDVRASVNAMADHLIADRRLLAENVESLEQTNLELVQARDQVIHSARLASVGTLAAGIAHEVGNPLGAIMGYVDVALSRARAAGADTEILDSIRDEAGRIDRIVRGLLDYARPKSQSTGPSGTGGVIDRVRQLLENQGKLDGVEVEWMVADEVPRVVMEPHRLEQVLVNLILNAVDALGDSAAPRIRVRLSAADPEIAHMPIRRAEDPPGINYMHRRRLSRDEGGRGVDPLFNARSVVLIEVSDNGPGVPAEHRESVFDPFFTTKEVGKGTGLGLSICARLVEGMGGRISVDSSEWGGARFSVRLPGHPEDGT